jgi:hypothetical protein
MSDVYPRPYCSSSDHCPHLLLFVDKTFRAAVGGSLMDAFNEKWFEICDAGGDDFDEREPFNDLLDQVHGLADDFNEYEVDDGPDSFCKYAVCFSESENSKMTAFQIFILKIQAS